MKKKHIDLLLSISEMDWVFSSGVDSQSLLSKVVATVAGHMKADVCSLYLYDEAARLLTLTATAGLPQDAVGRVTLKLGEGLVGRVMKGLAPICVKDGFTHPGFKHIKGINEESYRSFLVTPIARGLTRIGVLILQRREKNFFAADDAVAVKAIASQLANIIENAKLFMQKDAPMDRAPARHPPNRPRLVKGKAASDGYACAKSFRLDGDPMDALRASAAFAKRYGAEDLDRALVAAEQQLIVLQKKAEEHIADAGSFIFAAHILMLKDAGFVNKIRGQIGEGVNPPLAVMHVAKLYGDLFRASPNSLIREKAQDVADVSRRLVAALIGTADNAADIAGRVIIAADLYPSDMLKFFAQGIAGIVITSGGVTSHVAILARSLKIPLVIAEPAAMEGIENGTTVLVDADIGNVYVNPSREVLKHFADSNEARGRLKTAPPGARPAATSDGARVNLLLNVNLLRDMAVARRLPYDGVGLYRTEFPFILRNTFPTEEEQYRVYRTLLEQADGKEVTFRTLDVGGDKVLSYYHTQKEENPFLGMRSIRFSLNNRDIFRQQLNAILRAGHDRKIRVMFPMISSLDEFREAKTILQECAGDLGRRGVPCARDLKVGIMVEIPSVVTIIDTLAPACDFFSIGTNDLIQYTLAVDRTNEKVAGYYLPHHPAVLRSLKTVADAGARQGIGVSICGDMANNPAYIPFLLGIGIRDLSVDPVYFMKSYESIRTASLAGAADFARRLLACGDIQSATRVIRKGPGRGISDAAG